MKLLICYEMPTSQGLMSGHCFRKVNALTQLEIEHEAYEIRVELEKECTPTGRLVLRSITKFDE